MLRKLPMIVILGSTGTGKTKLSIELAERYCGEIISADSMQVYANLDIATAKATKEEQSRAKHHLLDVATPAEPYTVTHFRNAALPIIENLLAHSKCPIIVGGTNYYIESLLWNVLVDTKPAAATTTLADRKCLATSSTSDATMSENLKNISFLTDDEMSATTSELLHKHLQAIDPEAANRFHPNNKRKIMRAIEVFQQSGQTLSAKLKEQRQQPGGNRLGGPLRFPHTILFWLRCNQDVLNTRLDKRVDAMLEQGLLREIRAFHNEHKCDKSNADNPYSKGVLQTIGFKEFIPYLEQFNAANDQKIEEYLRANAYKMPTEEHFKSNNKEINKNNKSSVNDPTNSNNNENNETLPPGLELLSACLNELKLVTKRYSRKQIKWINNRFLATKERQVPNIYELDTSDVNIWNEAVLRRATTVIDCYRSDLVCEIEHMPKRAHPGEGLNEESSHFCDICERHFIGEYQFNLHLISNKHKRRMEGKRKLERRAEKNLNEVSTD